MNSKSLKKLKTSSALNLIFLFTYLVNLLLFGVDFYGKGLINWAFFPLLGWGIGLVSHYFSVFNPLFSVEKEVEKLKEKYKNS